jgi:hypothetical protein
MAGKWCGYNGSFSLLTIVCVAVACDCVFRSGLVNKPDDQNLVSLRLASGWFAVGPGLHDDGSPLPFTITVHHYHSLLTVMITIHDYHP